MAKHKAATEITIVNEERSAFAQFVDRYKFHFIGGALAVTAAIVFFETRGQASVREDQAPWDTLYAALGGKTTGARASLQELDAEPLQRAATDLDGKAAADWARLLAAYAYAEDDEFSKAREAAVQVANSSNKLLTGMTFPLGKDGQEETLAQHLKTGIEATEAFRARYKHLYQNPDPAPDAPVAVLKTALGDIEVALYPELAPKHVENFIKLAKDGFYDGTKFHRVLKDFMIQGGDPNSKEGAPETWGQGGPGYKIDKETNALIHLPLYLAAAKGEREVQSSGSQFYITTAPAHHLDGEHVVYGKVIAGESVVRAIESGAPDPAAPERPREPVTLTTVTLRE